MKVTVKGLGLISIFLVSLVGQVQAIELLYLMESKDQGRVIAKANGLKISDTGEVYVTSEDKGTILKIVDGNIDASSLNPEVFKNKKLGGIDILADGNLVVVNRGSGKVAVMGPDFSPISHFSQSGGSPGELSGPIPVAVSVNNNVFIGDKNKQIHVFNLQGLYLYSFGNQGSGGDMLNPTHISIDAEENVYVLEGQARFSVYDVFGSLIARFKSSELKDLYGKTPRFTAMTADLDGTMYLGNNIDKRVSIFDWRNRKLLGGIGSPGKSRTQYRDISHLSVNARGQIAILDKKNKKIEVFQLDQNSFATPIVTDLVEFGAQFEAQCESIDVFIDDKTLCIKPKKKGIVILGPDGDEQGKIAEEVKQPKAIYVGDQTLAVLGKNSLHVYSHDGSNIFNVGIYGSSAGSFKSPSRCIYPGWPVLCFGQG